MGKQQLLASLPSVDEILKSEEGLKWQKSYPRRNVLKAIREVIEEHRQAILRNTLKEISAEEMRAEIRRRIAHFSSFSLKPVINATGIVIHTNLGRSVLSGETMDNIRKVACGYSNLEYDLEAGKRGKRYSHIQKLLREITGAESGIVVNNNAAAVFVCLTALAKGREVVVSRGELVEIGGSFRIPDVMSSSGAILTEVGATNKTHLRDYERAINENTSLLLKVHQSNYRMVGFTKSVAIEELVTLGKSCGIPVMFDLGSGSLMDLKPYGIQIEPTVQEIVRSGVDIVTFSGDKLLGGPQGGIIVGKSELIEKIAKNPLMRAVRIDKLTLAALEAVLMDYLDEGTAKSRVPTLEMLLQDIKVIEKRAKKIASQLKKELEIQGSSTAAVEVAEDSSQSGGGALPEIEFPTVTVLVSPSRISVNKLEERLRRGKIPIVARIKENTLVLDARTIRDTEISSLVQGITAALKRP